MRCLFCETRQCFTLNLISIKLNERKSTIVTSDENICFYHIIISSSLAEGFRSTPLPMVNGFFLCISIFLKFGLLFFQSYPCFNKTTDTSEISLYKKKNNTLPYFKIKFWDGSSLKQLGTI